MSDPTKYNYRNMGSLKKVKTEIQKKIPTNVDFKRRMMAQKHTKKSTLWKHHSWLEKKAGHNRQNIVSKPMKIDKPTKDETQEKRIARPALPTRWISENISKLTEGASIVKNVGKKVANVGWRASLPVVTAKGAIDYVGMKTGLRDEDPNTITGSRSLDMATYPLNVMWKATKKWEQKRKDTKKGQYRDTYAGIVARDS